MGLIWLFAHLQGPGASKKACSKEQAFKWLMYFTAIPLKAISLIVWWKFGVVGIRARIRVRLAGSSGYPISTLPQPYTIY